MIKKYIVYDTNECSSYCEGQKELAKLLRTTVKCIANYLYKKKKYHDHEIYEIDSYDNLIPKFEVHEL